MHTSQESFLTEIINCGDRTIPEGKLAYLRERQRNKLFDLIIGCFLEKEEKKELTRASLARRLNKRPEQITRLLSAPGNWTLDTVCDLTLAICAGELDFSVRAFEEMPQRNADQLSILMIDNTSIDLERPKTSATPIQQNISYQIHA